MTRITIVSLAALVLAGVASASTEATEVDLAVTGHSIRQEQPPTVGDPYEYEVAVRSLTPKEGVRDAIVRFTVPDNFELIAAVWNRKVHGSWRTFRCDEEGPTATCRVGRLKTKRLYVNVSVLPTLPGEATSVASVESASPDPDESNNTSELTITVEE